MKSIQEPNRDYFRFSHLFSNPWVALILILGILAHVLAFMIFRVTTDPSLPKVTASSVFQYANNSELKENPIIEERALLYDPEPLFLPTQWNAAPQHLDESLSLVSDSPFRSFKTTMLLNQENLVKMQLAEPSLPIVSKPRDTLTLKSDELFSHFGQTAITVKSLPPRNAFMSIRNVETAESVLALPIEIPGLSLEERELEQFVEFSLVIDTIGSVGEPLVERSTGNSELDGQLRVFVSGSSHVQRLKRGYYRISIGP